MRLNLRVLALLAIVSSGALVSSGCASPRPEAAAPRPITVDPAFAKMQERVAVLEARVERIENATASEKDKRAAPRPAGWSCMAKCGKRSTQTTEFRVDYDRVTGHGPTAAEAYEDMLRSCHGTIYERLEDNRFVGGDMKSTCISEAGAH